MTPVRSRRPRRVYDAGSEPDARFSLANERTALAWLRTSLAFLAFGVGLASLRALADLPTVLDAVAVAACVLGGGLAVRAATGWMRVERALRLAEPLPAPRALLVQAAVVGVLALVLAGVVLVQVTS